MSYNKAVTTGQEALEEPFGIEEIFYSRTDKRGILVSGNDVFRRVSGYDWDRLIGAPHRIVRSPDMPRAIFHLLWKTIQQDKPLCAIVKNRTATGRWYWVLAAVVPLDGGYLSVRIKPTGALFAQTKALYAKLLAAEQMQSLSPEKSCALLLDELRELGFGSYEEFMTALLEQGMAGRDAALGRANAAHLRALTTVTASLKATQDEQRALMAEFDALQAVPTNMRIIASRLEPSGGPISAISDNYKFASNEIAHQLEGFAGSENNQYRVMAAITGEAILMTNIARLLSELPRQFSQEDPRQSPVDFEQELKHLSAIETQYKAEARAAIVKAEQVTGELNEASAEIRRMTLGLDTIRVMGRVESGLLGPSGAGLSSTIDQLDDRHAMIAGHLQKLMDLSAGIKSAINAFLRMRSSD